MGRVDHVEDKRKGFLKVVFPNTTETLLSHKTTGAESLLDLKSTLPFNSLESVCFKEINTST